MKIKKGHILVIIFFLVTIIAFTDLFGININQRDTLNKKQADIISQNIYQWFNATELKHYEGNNRDYNWYVDQFNTGPFSNNNCGPSVAVMSLKWLNQEFKGSVIKAREKYYPEGDWWSLNTVRSYLTINGVNYSFIFFDDDKREDKKENIEKLKAEIENNNIIILCVDMGYMPREYSKRLRTNRFYDYANGHFIIVKGYIIVDNRIYFEIYDPNNLGESYSDDTPKGKDRYYDATSLSEAITNWSDYGLVIDEHINYNISD